MVALVVVGFLVVVVLVVVGFLVVVVLVVVDVVVVEVVVEVVLFVVEAVTAIYPSANEALFFFRSESSDGLSAELIPLVKNHACISLPSESSLLFVKRSLIRGFD